MNGLVDHDALVKERAKMLPEDAEFHYISSEMVEPLIGGIIIGGRVEEADGLTPFPVLRVMLKGAVYSVIVSMDDEQNGGGRLMIEKEEVSRG
jgi:hypothetical protein